MWVLPASPNLVLFRVLFRHISPYLAIRREGRGIGWKPLRHIGKVDYCTARGRHDWVSGHASTRQGSLVQIQYRPQARNPGLAWVPAVSEATLCFRVALVRHRHLGCKSLCAAYLGTLADSWGVPTAVDHRHLRELAPEDSEGQFFRCDRQPVGLPLLTGRQSGVLCRTVAHGAARLAVAASLA